MLRRPVDGESEAMRQRKRKEAVGTNGFFQPGGN